MAPSVTSRLLAETDPATTGIVPDGWHDFFVAQAGATAALAGLVFVAVSINLERILSFPRLPHRAAVTVALFAGILLQSPLALMGEVTLVAFGALVLVIAGGIEAFVVISGLRMGRDRANGHKELQLAAMYQLALLPQLVGGVLLVAGGGAGLYWVAAGYAVSTLVALTNAWVLLVEILR